MSQAKALALAWDVPFVGVNHLEAHLFAALLDHPEATWPLVVVLVSGGHTMIVSMEGPGRYRLLGQTLDDAAGEAFDKVARYLGLGYPGGPAIQKAASGGRPGRLRVSPGAHGRRPRPLLQRAQDVGGAHGGEAPRGLQRGRGGLVPAGRRGRDRGQGDARPPA